MARFIINNAEQVGRAPGSLIFVGDQKVDKPALEAIEFDPNTAHAIHEVELSQIPEIKQNEHVSWLDITGLHDTSIIQRVGEVFDLHLLIQEDILNTGQRPKCEEYDNCIFLVLKMLRIDKDNGHITAEQLSMVVGHNYLLSFQEEHEDVFEAVRERLLRPTTKIRQRKSDYLAYALMDAVVDKYILIIEQFGDKIEQLEHELITAAKPSHLEKIYNYKREINFLRKTVRPVRELVMEYKTAESDLIEERTMSYIKDLEDHVMYATEAIETYQVMLNDQLNLYQSTINNRLNDILRVLTIFSVVFIPLTFLAGIYGMNFKYLPELEYRYAYPTFWAVLIGITAIMLGYFKRKRWL